MTTHRIVRLAIVAIWLGLILSFVAASCIGCVSYVTVPAAYPGDYDLVGQLPGGGHQ